MEAFGTELIQRMGLNKTLDDIFPPKDGAREDKYDLYPKPFYNYATMARIPPGSDVYKRQYYKKINFI